IISQYSVYTTNLVEYVNKIMDENPDLAKYISAFVVNASEETDNYLNDVVLPAVQSLLLPNISDWLKNFTTSVVNIIKVFWNIIIGIIISIYVLSGKERVVRNGIKLLYSMFDVKVTNRFVDSIRFIHHTFIGFFAGKIADSLIIGVICYICLLIMKMPYAALISLIIGITNIIPFVGPFIGAVPSVILVLMIDPRMALFLVIFIVILQQVDGNIIGPKILSGSTGVNAFWILFSITLFGGLWGIVGMIVGVPITAVVISSITRLSNKKLEAKNLPTNAELYEDLGHIDEDGVFVKYVYVKPPKKEPDVGTKKLIAFLKKVGNGLKNFGIFIWSSLKMLFEKIVAAIKKKIAECKDKRSKKNKK
ncbi:MAG: AI-2E family transporter, partial [bacterium]|nr:AI-2E family transporter [bacterium]